MFYKSILPISFTALVAFGAAYQDESIPESFIKIGSLPRIIKYKNELEINNQGGHLQGVQLLERGGEEFAILTGSSSTYAYYSVAKKGNQSEVLSINRLMDTPFKHAGGFQVFQNLMAVGIEDNSAKDKSKVCIYEIDEPEKPSVAPLTLIERRGEPLRATAGCAGITKIGEQVLVVVGDWDTKHLDFYLCSEHRLRQKPTAFEKVFTIDTERMDRSNWADNGWHSYQNINLVKDTDGKLYLFGFQRVDQRGDIADLFLVENKGLREFKLSKIVSRTFTCKEGARFSAGAGVTLQEDGTLKVVACGSHIEDALVLNVFE
jgi:hypothetical protein